MSRIVRCELPAESLLGRYLVGGAYADCYTTHVTRDVSHAQFVEAFYTTALFKLERVILSLFASRASSDAEAGRLARGELDAFAAWSVEDRATDQLLLRDFTGRTRSWLMVAAPTPLGTQLFFGSAVVPAGAGKAGHARMGFAFTALLGFHKLYSRALLRAATSRLVRGP
jgi:hypothetical protein